MDSEILVAADHGGIELKAHLVRFLKKKGIRVKDLGTHTETSVDYPDYGLKLAQKVAHRKNRKGILICKSGIGMTVAANKVRGVRAALCVNKKMAQLAREHTNSNVLVLGALFVPKKRAEEIVNVWLKTPFEGGRHERRINKIIQYEEKR